MIKAKTNFGEATVRMYRGYNNLVCIAFDLDIGGTFAGWDFHTLLNCTHHSLMLDGGSNLICTNILEVMEALRIKLISQGITIVNRKSIKQ